MFAHTEALCCTRTPRHRGAPLWVLLLLHSCTGALLALCASACFLRCGLGGALLHAGIAVLLHSQANNALGGSSCAPPQAALLTVTTGRLLWVITALLAPMQPVMVPLLHAWGWWCSHAPRCCVRLYSHTSVGYPSLPCHWWPPGSPACVSLTPWEGRLYKQPLVEACAQLPTGSRFCKRLLVHESTAC